MSRKPCRRCGNMLHVGSSSLPNPMCQPCRRIDPQRKPRAATPARPAVYCTDCDIRIGYALTDTPRCRPCRVKARARARVATYPTTTARARHRRQRAQHRLDLAAQGTAGGRVITAGPCNWCGSSFVAVCTNSTGRWCSPACDMRAKKQRRTTASHGGTGWRWSDFMRMARKFNYCCAYCGTKPDRLDPDHVVPLARGGDDSLSNLLPTCLPCNSDKRDLLLHEWHTDRQRRGQPPRTTACTGTQYSHLALVTDVQPRYAA